MSRLMRVSDKKSPEAGKAGVEFSPHHEVVHPLVACAVIYLAHGQTLSIRNRSNVEPLRDFIIKRGSSKRGFTHSHSAGVGMGGAPLAGIGSRGEIGSNKSC
ncbi:MAG: hypothetical protein ACI9KE_000599 [Polyangiales bacterium]|jgi:hypothetical protein